MAAPTPAPGWYPDGTTPGIVRWWDGLRWTEYTQAAPRTPEPRSEPPAAPARPEPIPPEPEPTRPRHRSSEPAPPRHRSSEPPEFKVSAFGARKQAKALAARLDEVGALDGVVIEQQTEAARHVLADIRSQVVAAQAELTTLRSQVIDARERVDLQEVGLYDFTHPAEGSVELAAELAQVRGDIRACVRDGDAWVASTQFVYNSSAAKGKKFVSDLSKMCLSAYNAEAENAVKTVKAGNIDTAIKRLRSVSERIGRYGAMIELRITPRYELLRERELTLTARHMRAVEVEREAERERKAELREQARVEAEMKRERQRLEDQLRKEREHYAHVVALLREKGDDEAARAAEAEMEAKIADVSRAIEDVDYRVANQRAGYVYVISNVGAFGERMVKIGMTRRLEPLDRVRELGDASVPFRYDVHALFFADDAPGVETMLHREFEALRVNKVNPRREFFYVTPEEVLDVLRERQVTVVEFTVEPEAEEYRLSGGTVGQGSAETSGRHAPPPAADDGDVLEVVVGSEHFQGAHGVGSDRRVDRRLMDLDPR